MATLESERVAQVQWQFRLVLGMGSLPCAIVLVCHVAETAGKWWKGTNGGETYGKVDIDDKHESGSSGSRKVTHGKNKEQPQKAPAASGRFVLLLFFAFV